MSFPFLERLNYPWLQEFFFSTTSIVCFFFFFLLRKGLSSVTRFVRALPFQGLIKNDSSILLISFKFVFSLSKKLEYVSIIYYQNINNTIHGNFACNVLLIEFLLFYIISWLWVYLDKEWKIHNMNGNHEQFHLHPCRPCESANSWFNTWL